MGTVLWGARGNRKTAGRLEKCRVLSLFGSDSANCARPLQASPCSQTSVSLTDLPCVDTILPKLGGKVGLPSFP